MCPVKMDNLKDAESNQDDGKTMKWWETPSSGLVVTGLILEIREMDERRAIMAMTTL